MNSRLDINWFNNASCKDMGVELFMSEKREDIIKAKAICAGCLVLQECLDYAMENKEHGVWGGTTERQRRRIRTSKIYKQDFSVIKNIRINGES